MYLVGDETLICGTNAFIFMIMTKYLSVSNRDYDILLIRHRFLDQVRDVRFDHGYENNIVHCDIVPTYFSAI